MTEDLKTRTKKLALGVIELAGELPRGSSGSIISRQLVKSGTSVGANYRAARRARSKAEFIAKPGIVEEEADETLFWIEMLTEGGILAKAPVSVSEKVTLLSDEAEGILSMTVASIRTAKKKSD
jgi:four helix bundle protein